MIIICLVHSYRLRPLKEAIQERNKALPDTPPWSIVELMRFNIAGTPVSRIALLCDQPPPPFAEVAIEAVIDECRYCPICFAEGTFRQLPPQNKSGYCTQHQDRNPLRSERKRKVNLHH
jgi:hypothetical protein